MSGVYDVKTRYKPTFLGTYLLKSGYNRVPGDIKATPVTPEEVVSVVVDTVVVTGSFTPGSSPEDVGGFSVGNLLTPSPTFRD